MRTELGMCVIASTSQDIVLVLLHAVEGNSIIEVHFPCMTLYMLCMCVPTPTHTKIIAQAGEYNQVMWGCHGNKIRIIIAWSFGV